MISELFKQVGRRTVTYIELGPEPVNTSVIIEGLTKASCRVTYIGIDINTASRLAMEKEIGVIVGAENFYYLARDYHHLQLSDVIGQTVGELGDGVILLTSLGSQEGNEHPKSIHALYNRLLRPGDLLASELQILPETNHYPIFEFSHHPLWRDVSRAFRKRMFGDVASEYGTVLLPINISEIGRVKCAVAMEKLLNSPEASGDIMISNYCLKYSFSQLKKVRSAFGFEIVSSFVTGDGSVAFQLLTPTESSHSQAPSYATRL